MVSNDFLTSFFGSSKPPQRKKKVEKKVVADIPQPKGSVLYKGYYFLDVKKSKGGDKRYEATFMNAKTGKNRMVSFGKKGEKDYIQHNNKDLLEFYDFKHKNEDWRDLMSSAALNKYILWNKKTLEGSVRDYKKRLKLKN